MGYLSEADYSELIDYLISGLERCRADDIIRQIRELETVNVIEETQSAARAARKPPALNQIKLVETETYFFQSDQKVDKKLEREAVSEYRSRPMSCEEMYHASIDILESYLLSVPEILEGIGKNLQLDGLSDVSWENESGRHAGAPVNIVEAVGKPEPEVRAEMGRLLQTLKNIS